MLRQGKASRSSPPLSITVAPRVSPTAIWSRARQTLAAICEDVDAPKTLSGPFLNWAGKAERLFFDVLTLPLFVHERLSTAAIMETLKGHSRDRQTDMLDLFGESDLPIHDRLLLARELLHHSGSIFVQMSDTNLHHVREVVDEVFGAECLVSQISFQTTSGFATRTLATLGDFLLWYAKDPERLKVRKLFEEQLPTLGEGNARWVLLPDGSYRGVRAAEKRGSVPLPDGARLYSPDNLQGQSAASEPQPFEFEGKTYRPGANSHWKPNYPEGLERLAAAGRIHVAGDSIRYRRFASDFPCKERRNLWTDTLTGSFIDEKLYVVQTNPKVVDRCLLMTSDPGDLVFDPICGSGTTAWCAEKWGRRRSPTTRRACPSRWRGDGCLPASSSYTLSRSRNAAPPAALSTCAGGTGRGRSSWAASCRTSRSNELPGTNRRRKRCCSTGRRRTVR